MSRHLGGLFLVVALCVGVSTVGCGKKNKTEKVTNRDTIHRTERTDVSRPSSDRTHPENTRPIKETTTETTRPAKETTTESTRPAKETTTESTRPAKGTESTKVEKTEKTEKKTTGTTTKKVPPDEQSYLVPAQRNALRAALAIRPQAYVRTSPAIVETVRRPEGRG